MSNMVRYREKRRIVIELLGKGMMFPRKGIPECVPQASLLAEIGQIEIGDLTRAGPETSPPPESWFKEWALQRSKLTNAGFEFNTQTIITCN